MRDEGRRCEDSTVELAAASESLSGRGFVGLRRFARTFFQERRSPPNFATAVAPPLAGDPPGRHEPRDRLHGRPWVAHKLRKRPPVAVRDQFYPCIAARSIWSPAASVPRHETSIAASADAVTSPHWPSEDGASAETIGRVHVETMSSITLQHLPAAPRSHRRRRRSGIPQLARLALSPLSPRSSACTRTAQTPPRRPPTGTSLAGRSWPAGGGALLRRSPLQQASIAAAVSAWKSLTRSQAELAWTRRWRVEFPVAVSARLRLPTR